MFFEEHFSFEWMSFVSWQCMLVCCNDIFSVSFVFFQWNRNENIFSILLYYPSHRTLFKLQELVEPVWSDFILFHLNLKLNPQILKSPNHSVIAYQIDSLIESVHKKFTLKWVFTKHKRTPTDLPLAPRQPPTISEHLRISFG